MSRRLDRVVLDRNIVWQAMKNTVLRPRAHVTGLLLVLVFLSAIALVWTTDHHRAEFVKLQGLYQTQDKLYTEWTQLLLEESTWSSPLRVQGIASDKFDMRIPDSAMIRQVQESEPNVKDADETPAKP